MFGKWLAGINNVGAAASAQNNNAPENIGKIQPNLRQRFRHGVQYNMKLVIRGDHNTGKSVLLNRLQGGPFLEQYIPTPQIKIANVPWSYKVTDDVIKVEVWDVVDVAKEKPSENLKISPTGISKTQAPQGSFIAPLDAQIIDVYQNCDGVMFIYDMTKRWTFDYIGREIGKVPENIPILIIGNFRDLGEHRAVTREDIDQLIEEIDRPGIIEYAESSMLNGYGLKYIYKFLNIPFLNLQANTLRKQLETNEAETKSTLEELKLTVDTPEQNYERFLDYLQEVKSRSKEESSQSNKTHIPTIKDLPNAGNATVVKKNGKSAEKADSATGTKTEPKRRSKSKNEANDEDAQPKSVSKYRGTNKNAGIDVTKKESKATVEPPATQFAETHNIDDFRPEGDDLDNFLDETPTATESTGNGTSQPKNAFSKALSWLSKPSAADQKATASSPSENHGNKGSEEAEDDNDDDDEDEIGYNPMVAEDEDLDGPEIEIPDPVKPAFKKSSISEEKYKEDVTSEKNRTYEDMDEEEDEDAPNPLVLQQPTQEDSDEDFYESKKAPTSTQKPAVTSAPVAATATIDDDEDEDGANPLVFRDDLEQDDDDDGDIDYYSSKTTKSSSTATKDLKPSKISKEQEKVVHESSHEKSRDRDSRERLTNRDRERDRDRNRDRDREKERPRDKDEKDSYSERNRERDRDRDRHRDRRDRDRDRERDRDHDRDRNKYDKGDSRYSSPSPPTPASPKSTSSSTPTTSASNSKKRDNYTSTGLKLSHS